MDSSALGTEEEEMKIGATEEKKKHGIVALSLLDFVVAELELYLWVPAGHSNGIDGGEADSAERYGLSSQSSIICIC